MKIILIRYHDTNDVNSRLPESLNRIRGIVPPLGLLYIAAVLEQAGYTVQLIDAVALDIYAGQLRTILMQEAPDIVGITSMISNVHGAIEAARIAKECGARVVMGGPLLTVYPEEIVGYDCVDYGIIGEGEYSMLALTRAIEQNQPLEGIPGLVLKENGRIHAYGEAFIDDLNHLPVPARHLISTHHYSTIITDTPAATMIATRGCPFQCGFCMKGPQDKKHRTRNPKNVVDEMEFIMQHHGVKEILFYDDTITLDRENMVLICEEIIRRRLPVRWESPTRVDCVDTELLRLMHRAGCKRLRYGVESGNGDILKSMHKSIDLTRVHDVFTWTKKTGIETFAYFIIGYFHETAQTIKETIAYARALNPDLAMFTVATPYPKTHLFELAKTAGLIDDNYWRDFVLGKRSDRLPYLVPHADIWVRRAYRSFYFRPRFVAKRLLEIHSFSDIRRYLQAAGGLINFRMNRR